MDRGTPMGGSALLNQRWCWVRAGVGVRQTGSLSPRSGSETVDGLSLRFIKPKFRRGTWEPGVAGGSRLYCKLGNPQDGIGMDRGCWIDGRLRFIKPKVCAGRRRGLGTRQTGSSPPRVGSETLDGLSLRFIKPKKLTPPGSGDLDEWAERRQVENPSTDGGRSSPRRGVDFQPAGRVMRRGRLGWAWLCDRASGVGGTTNWKFVATGRVEVAAQTCHSSEQVAEFNCSAHLAALITHF